jgi:hypothetical protein
MERTSISVSQLELRDYMASQRSLRMINSQFSTCVPRLRICLSIKIDVISQIAILCLRLRPPVRMEFTANHSIAR